MALIFQMKKQKLCKSDRFDDKNNNKYQEKSNAGKKL